MKIYILKTYMHHTHPPISYNAKQYKKVGEFITYHFQINKLPFEVTLHKPTNLESEESYEIINGKYIPFKIYYSTKKDTILNKYFQHIKTMK